VNGTNIFVGTDYDGGIYNSTDNGASWIRDTTGLTNKSVYSLTVNGMDMFAGTKAGGVFLTINNGASWIAVNSGMANTSVISLAISGTNLFAGTSDAGVWRRPLSEMVSVLPQYQEHSSLQTRIRVKSSGSLFSAIMVNYSIQSRCLVNLGIYTISGKKVALLEQGEKAPGEYSVRFDGSSIPSGIYLYRFKAGNYLECSRFRLFK
jgi:hypothetical protein